MLPALAIDYAAGMRTLRDQTADAIIQAIRDEMPAVWIDRYHRMCEGPTNVLEVSLQNFAYLFDYCSTTARNWKWVTCLQEHVKIAPWWRMVSQRRPGRSEMRRASRVFPVRMSEEIADIWPRMPRVEVWTSTCFIRTRI